MSAPVSFLWQWPGGCLGSGCVPQSHPEDLQVDWLSCQVSQPGSMRSLTERRHTPVVAKALRELDLSWNQQLGGESGSRLLVSVSVIWSKSRKDVCPSSSSVTETAPHASVTALLALHTHISRPVIDHIQEDIVRLVSSPKDRLKLVEARGG